MVDPFKVPYHDPEKIEAESGFAAGRSKDGLPHLPSNYVHIGEACQVKGDIINCKTLLVAGALEGDLETEEVIVLQGAKIEGKIKTQFAEIHGEVVGDLTVEDLLNIHETGSVHGATRYGSIVVVPGGVLNGNCAHLHRQVVSRPRRRKRTAVICDDVARLPAPSLSPGR